MLTAVMLDRRAITLRSVAIAAMILLLHRPETLFSPGFQMSFAATAALVAVFNGLRGAAWSVAPARLAEMAFRAGPVLRRRGAGDGPLRGGAFQPDRRLRAGREPPDRAADGQPDHARRGGRRAALAAGPVGARLRGDGTGAGLDAGGRGARRCHARRGRPCAEPAGRHAGPDRDRRADRDPVAGQGAPGPGPAAGAGGAALAAAWRGPMC
jgi:hypothetical protein